MDQRYFSLNLLEVVAKGFLGAVKGTKEGSHDTALIVTINTAMNHLQSFSLISFSFSQDSTSKKQLGKLWFSNFYGRNWSRESRLVHQSSVSEGHHLEVHLHQD